MSRREQDADGPAAPDSAEWAAADDERESADAAAYRRRRKPVPVRRNRWRTAAAWARRAWRPVLVLTGIGVAGGALYHLFFQSPWFVLASSDQIAVVGAQQAPVERIQAVFAGDLGRNVFYIPLEARRQAVEQIGWVSAAAVLREWPARIEVRVRERTPIAFVRNGGGVELIDANGVLLERPASGSFDFPVLTGLAGVGEPADNAPQWVEQRRQPMRVFLDLQRAMAPAAGTAASGAPPSLRDFSEIDLHDPRDVVATVSNGNGGSLLLHLGDHDFAARYALFLAHGREWEASYPQLAAVNLQTDGQARLEMTPAAPEKPAPGRAGIHP